MFAELTNDIADRLWRTNTLSRKEAEDYAAIAVNVIRQRTPKLIETLLSCYINEKPQDKASAESAVAHNIGVAKCVAAALAFEDDYPPAPDGLFDKSADPLIYEALQSRRPSWES